MHLFVSHDIVTIITLSSFHPLLNSHSYTHPWLQPLLPSLLSVWISLVSFHSHVSDDPCMQSKSPIETRVTKKNTLQPWLFIIITWSNGKVSAHRNGPLILQIEKEGNKNRRKREWHTGSECCNVTGVGIACRLRYKSCILKYLWSRGLNIHMGSMSFLLDGGHTASTREHRCLECDYTLKLSPLFRRTAPGGMLCWEEKHTTKRRA